MEEKDQIIQEEAKSHINNIAKWYRTYAIAQIIFIILTLIISIVPIIEGQSALSDFAIIYYLIPAGIFIALMVTLLRAAKAAEASAEYNSNEEAVSFLRNTKKYWKFLNIILIVLISIIFLSSILVSMTF